MGYQGTDRRKHRVYITRTTEYHVRDGICVAVRDRRSQNFLSSHMLLDLALEQGIRFDPICGSMVEVERLRVGDAICFCYRQGAGHERELVTGRVEQLRRPSKQEVLTYPPTEGGTRTPKGGEDAAVEDQPTLQKPS